MEPVHPSAIGIELVVADLDRSIELFCDVLGCPLVARGPAALVAGEAAQVDLGAIVVTLLCPADAGDGPILGHREPRLAQIVLHADAGTVASTRQRSIDAGLSVVPNRAGYHLDPDALAGALGANFAIVVTGEGGEEAEAR